MNASYLDYLYFVCMAFLLTNTLRRLYWETRKYFYELPIWYTNICHDYCCHGPLTRYVKLRVAHAPGMPGTFPPTAEFKGNRELAIPACITARTWRTCRDACRDCLPAVAGKTFPAFPAHAHPQLYVFDKKPIAVPSVTAGMTPFTKTYHTHAYLKLLHWIRDTIMFINDTSISRLFNSYNVSEGHRILCTLSFR